MAQAETADRAASGRQRLIVVGLDGYEAQIADAMIARGELPNLDRLNRESASIDLDHGRNKLTGLSWQQFAAGQAPRDSGKWSAVDFDPNHYVASQPMSTRKPFLASAGRRAVILDAPYFDLAKCRDMTGLVNWGAHDPGVAPYCRPASLFDEIKARFGPYPASDDIYAFTWTDPEASRRTAENLRQALAVRSDITCWMLSERVPDWDLAITVVSELHSAIEPLWHGFDPHHPLHQHASAEPARKGLFAIYRELDQMIGNLQRRFPDAAIALFWMHGMGHNDADIASMILLPELLYRNAFGKKNFDAPTRWTRAGNLPPPLEPGESWSTAVFNEMGCVEFRRPPASQRAIARLLDIPARSLGRRRERGVSLDWMPSQGYGFAWPDMPAFALPSFYDGRIRMNVVGRESKGTIVPADYSAAMDAVDTLLREVRDVRTGLPVVKDIYRTSPGDPMAVPKSNGDIEVLWDGQPTGFTHDRLGDIGPVPFRRTGGHTGGLGRFCLISKDTVPGHFGVTDAMDVSVVLEDWLGLKPTGIRSGASFLSRLESTSSEDTA
jgi:predicted AlkP superfamily phosphohydrolase/phosphomutase